MKPHQSTRLPPIARHPAYRRAIGQIKDALAFANKRCSTLSETEKINYARLAVFGPEAIETLIPDEPVQTGKSSPGQPNNSPYV